MFKEETLAGPQETEHFLITVEELQSHFEALGGKKVSAWAGHLEGMEMGPRAAGWFPLMSPLSCAPLGVGSTHHCSHGCPVDNLDQYVNTFFIP